MRTINKMLAKWVRCDYNGDMSKRLQIELSDQDAMMVARESEALGLSPEEYANRVLAKQALRDKLRRADEEGGEYSIEEVFDPLIAQYSSLNVK